MTSAVDETAVARVGSVIDGRYKVLEVMAAGSMGSVYKAERVPVGKLVAVKFLHASLGSDNEFAARFERETRVMSKLNHPNCVSVLDFGAFEGEPYLVMDFVDGTTLRARIDKGAVPPEQALAIARQMAAGLAHAHAQGVVHRDIKPANVMITDDIGHGERVRLLDFGLARLRGNVGRDATQTNLVVGTPNYMAPEQTVPGATVDARTDVYAVGVVLFEMIVGDRPFHAEDTLQLLGMHRAAPIPRLADRVPEGTGLPRGLQEVIDKAMAKSPADRYQNAMELQTAIDDVINGRVVLRESEPTLVAPPKLPPIIVPTGKRGEKRTDTAAVAPTIEFDTDDEEPVRPRRKPWFGLVVVFGGAAAMAGYVISRSPAEPPATKSDDSALAVASGDVASGSSTAGSGSAATAGSAGSDLVAVASGAPPIEIDAAPIEIDAAPVEIDAAVPDAAEIGSGSGAGSEEDPETAEDPDPVAKGSAAKQPEDEAADAPKTQEEIESHAPATPPVQLATTVQGAVAMIKDGKRLAALDSLRALWKKNPQSSYIPFLLGNLYYDQTWWGVAMDHYKAAIDKNRNYRKNPTLNRNVIRMLASTKTRQKAANFLRGVIGSPAHGYLEQAAKHEDNPIIRKQAANLARYIR